MATERDGGTRDAVGADRGQPGSKSAEGAAGKGKDKTGTGNKVNAKAPPAGDPGLTGSEGQDTVGSPAPKDAPADHLTDKTSKGVADEGGGILDIFDKLFKPVSIFNNPILDSIWGALLPTPIVAGMKLGEIMGKDVTEVQNEVDSGNVPGAETTNDPGMGRVDKIPGNNPIDRPGGLYSHGNAASDDRAVNENGAGGGMVGGGAGGESGLSNRNAAPAPAAAPAAGAAVPGTDILAPTVNSEIGRLLLDQKKSAAQAGGGKTILTSGQGLGTPAKTAAQILFGV